MPTSTCRRTCATSFQYIGRYAAHPHEGRASANPRACFGAGLHPGGRRDGCIPQGRRGPTARRTTPITGARRVFRRRRSLIATVLELQLRAVSKKQHGDVAGVLGASRMPWAKNLPGDDAWIKSIEDLHRSKPPPPSALPGLARYRQAHGGGSRNSRSVEDVRHRSRGREPGSGAALAERAGPRSPAVLLRRAGVPRRDLSALWVESLAARAQFSVYLEFTENAPHYTGGRCRRTRPRWAAH